MNISVMTSIDAMHYWPDAPPERGYLRECHTHAFIVKAFLEVKDPDRQVEFHDLKDTLERALLAISKEIPCTLFRDFGSMSCEQIGLEILKEIPILSSVEVSEDGKYSAFVNHSDLKMGIVTICGSTRFKDAHLEAMLMLEAKGYAAFMVGGFMHADKLSVTAEEKREFDVLHKLKIDRSDWIYVVNVGGYIGESTRSEIRYAEFLGKPVVYLEEPKEKGETL